MELKQLNWLIQKMEKMNKEQMAHGGNSYQDGRLKPNHINNYIK